MITLAMPVGSAHGWGICGKYITREMAALRPGEIRLLSHPFTAEHIGDELEFQSLAAVSMRNEESAGFQAVNGIVQLPGPLLTCIADKKMNTWAPQIRGTRTVGYTFFEENLLERAWMETARRCFDQTTSGSSWCTEVLKSYGLENVQTVIQGIDPRVFFPWPQSGAPEREFFRDRFVIFSGGKFEYRKGQDVVISAVKTMQQRHPDVILINAWFNPWQPSIDSMSFSLHITMPKATGNFVTVMNQILAHNGLDMTRVITLDRRPNALMPRIYRNSDVGLFPNRCEGGTNLVLMEFMACAKPVVATASTGHSDIVTPKNAQIINITGETTINAGFVAGGEPIARWPEPDLADTIDKLEWAYQNRPAAAALGHQAGIDLAQMTWTRAAERFLHLLTL